MVPTHKGSSYDELPKRSTPTPQLAENPKIKNSPTDFVGELETNLLHLSHTLHHRYHLDELLKVTQGE